MINKESFKLFDKLVKEDNYKYMFDLSIIYQVSSYIESYELIFNDKEFQKICNEVKRLYLNNNIRLDDELVNTAIENLE